MATSSSTDLVDPDSVLPPFEQIRRGILAQLATGILRPGDRLPAIRALATDLGLAPGTVARAYKELEAAEVLHTARGAGTRIADPLPDGVAVAPAGDLDPELARLLAAPIAEARAAGHDPEAVLTAVRTLLTSAGGGPAAAGTLDE